MPKNLIVPGLADPNTTSITGGARPKFRLVYFAQEAVKGEAQQWDVSQALGYGVEDVAADNCTTVAGVCAATVAAAGWGWIQTAGYCDYLITDEAVDAPATDPFLRCMNDNKWEGATTAEVTALADNVGALAVTAINLAEDAVAVGKGILICHYQ